MTFQSKGRGVDPKQYGTDYIVHTKYGRKMFNEAEGNQGLYCRRSVATGHEKDCRAHFAMTKIRPSYKVSIQLRAPPTIRRYL